MALAREPIEWRTTATYLVGLDMKERPARQRRPRCIPRTLQSITWREGEAIASTAAEIYPVNGYGLV